MYCVFGSKPVMVCDEAVRADRPRRTKSSFQPDAVHPLADNADVVGRWIPSDRRTVVRQRRCGRSRNGGRSDQVGAGRVNVNGEREVCRTNGVLTMNRNRVRANLGGGRYPRTIPVAESTVAPEVPDSTESAALDSRYPQSRTARA